MALLSYGLYVLGIVGSSIGLFEILAESQIALLGAVNANGFTLLAASVLILWTAVYFQSVEESFEESMLSIIIDLYHKS